MKRRSYNIQRSQELDVERYPAAEFAEIGRGGYQCMVYHGPDDVTGTDVVIRYTLRTQQSTVREEDWAIGLQTSSRAPLPTRRL